MTKEREIKTQFGMTRLIIWYHKNKAEVWFRALTVGITIVLAAFAGQWLEQQVGARLSNATFLVLVGAFALVALLLYVEGRSDRIDAHYSSIDAKLDSALRKLGLSVQYVGDPDGAYKWSADVAKQAEREILILQYFLGSALDQRGSESAREEFYSTLKAKAEQGVTYKRIIQMTPQAWERKEWMGVFRRHLKDMVSLMKSNYPTYLKMSRGVIQTTFMIVDNRYLVWIIHAFGWSGQADLINLIPSTNVIGAFVFDDPAGDLVAQFRRLFNRVENSPGTVTVDDIPEPGDSESTSLES